MDGCTTSIWVPVAMIVSGRNSVWGLKDRFLYSVGLTVSVVSSATSNVWPSGAECATNSAARLPPAPTRLSTMTVCLKLADNLSDSERAIRSCVTPDGRSTTIAECLRLGADVIAASTTPATQAAKNATQSIPIVMIGLGDPVGTGLVDSLARPGGNVTGLSQMTPSVAVKRLELLRELVPQISRVLVLSHLSDPIAAPQVKALEETAQSLRVKLQIRDVRTLGDLPGAFDAGVKELAEGVIATGESIFVVNRAHMADLAARHRLPGVYHHKSIAAAGGLMAYQAVTTVQHRRAATYVDKLLRGAKPADLPIEQSRRSSRSSI